MNGNMKLFWKKVSNVNRGKVENWRRIKGEMRGRHWGGEVEV